LKRLEAILITAVLVFSVVVAATYVRVSPTSSTSSTLATTSTSATTPTTSSSINSYSSTTTASSSEFYYTYEIVNLFPHDQHAFTEGLVYDGGYLYESTGLYGQSTLRRVNLETGGVLQQHNLSSSYFGEGITIFGDEIIQLTWQSHIGFVYDKATFKLLQNFTYATEGWGLTNDGKNLIMSDGTSDLYILDPHTFQRIGQINVTDSGNPITSLNELEYINGFIYANVFLTNKIAIISPQTGLVRGWIYLTGIEKLKVQDPSDDVLNGIAYDAVQNRLFVTGKDWPQLFQIDLVPG